MCKKWIHIKIFKSNKRSNVRHDFENFLTTLYFKRCEKFKINKCVQELTLFFLWHKWTIPIANKEKLHKTKGEKPQRKYFHILKLSSPLI